MDQVVTQTLKAVFLIISDPERQKRLQSGDEYEIVLNGLNLPTSSRPALHGIINRIEQLLTNIQNETI